MKSLYLKLITIIIMFSACSKTPELLEPVALEHNVSAKIKTDIPNIKRIIIESQSDTQKKDRELIYKAYNYLLKNYGEPKYKGLVTVKIKKDPIKHPKVSWLVNSKEKRSVIFGTFHMYPSELPTIVHEMFHALYQTNKLIENYPEFILEGMAIYVENLYKYKTEAKVKTKLANLIKSDKICTKFKKEFDFNSPFAKYDSTTIYYLYIASGDFFANQNRNSKELILEMLNNKNNIKMSISKMMSFYQLSYAPCGFQEPKYPLQN